MGGFGSGRPKISDGQKAVTAFVSLDVSALARVICLRSDGTYTFACGVPHGSIEAVNLRVQGGKVILRYYLSGPHEPPREVEEPVPLAWSKCRLGGERPWLVCPNATCGRKVTRLYFGERPLCRRCLGLHYPSQRESPAQRVLRRAERIHRRLYGEHSGHGGLAFILEKPKGRHWKTFSRLQAEHALLVAQYCGAQARALNAMMASLEGFEAPSHDPSPGSTSHELGATLGATQPGPNHYLL